MSKESKCNGKKHCQSSSSSSDDSEVCHPVKCGPKCGKAHCCIKKCEGYCPEELLCLYKDAVVEIHSEFIIIGASGPAQPTGCTPLAPNSRADVILEGNGFFIKGHYIIAPAHLVLLPPSLSSVARRYPFIDQDPINGEFKNQMVRASRILVSVFNVNRKDNSFVYEADLVGVDGAGDIAVLKINGRRQWNLCNPCIEPCHPYFKLGSSRGSNDGEKVYLIGDPISDIVDRRSFNAVAAISEGLLADHRHLEYQGWLLAESILVSASAFAYSSGLPILNAQGEVLGMQTTSLSGVNPIVSLGDVDASLSLTQAAGSGYVSGPSEFFLRRVIRSLIKGSCSRKWNCQLETICDVVGTYYRYKKAYLGLAYDVFTGVDYDTTADYTSGVTPLGGAPRIRLDSYGNFLNAPSCKQLIGIRVLGLAGANPDDGVGVPDGAYYVPGGAATFAPFTGLSCLPASPLLGKLRPGDVITDINDVGLGDIGCQIAPSLITWRLCCGDQLELTYRRGGNACNNSDNSFTENYECLFTHTICLLDYPIFLDYPWYAVNAFPLLRATPFSPYPGFVFPNQLVNPQLPAANYPGAGVFHPSI